MFEFFRWRGLISAQLAAILKEQRMTRASTEHLKNAVAALATSVTAATDTIKAEVQKLVAAKADGDDATVDACAGKIESLTTALNNAVTDANAAVNATPAADSQADPNANPSPSKGDDAG